MVSSQPKSQVVGFNRWDYCRACGDTDLTPIIDLGVQEVVNFGDKPLVSAPLELVVCKACWQVQLRHEVDRDYLFRTYYFRSNANETYRKHLKALVDELMRWTDLGMGDTFVDIGSNDGTMLSMFPDDVRKVGFEPSKLDSTKGSEYSRYIVNDFFDFDTWKAHFGVHKAKAIYAGFMFYDLSDPLSFLKDIKKVLDPKGLFVIEMNYLPVMLSNNAVDNISAEHQCYYTLRTLQNLLFQAGLQAEDVSFSDINGGAFRVYIRHRSNRKPSETVSGVLAGEKAFESMEPYLAFALRVKEQMHALSATVKLAVAKDRAIVDLVGASTRGLTIVQQAGLDKSLIRAVVERNMSKVGKTYAGIPVISEEQSKASPADLYVILPMSFSKEIIARMPWGKSFLIPLPEVRVIRSAKSTESR